MNSFKDREDAFEKRFARDEELQFKVQARGCKLVGLWAAELMGKSGSDADDYAREVVISDLEEVGQEDVYRKLAGDLGEIANESEIRQKMEECFAAARDQIINEI
ncbi:MAG: DUF1476 domain-containing protein [Albidovulum sp.]|nr:DUF1476 domain-containing protein [Albidovulum sp.]MDE0303789.1 DUF1476 domain-containing protein [Albidovulum sp.]MDE0532378.1 DUF1476 domain-containing protein [Albidovulum sp.]